MKGNSCENEEIYRLVSENALDALIVGDEKGNYIYTSPSMEKIFGYKQGELIGRSSFELFHPDDIALNREKLKIALEKNEVPSVEFRFKKKNGEYVWCDVTLKAVQTDNGDRRLVVVAREITERKKMQEEIRKYSENLEELVTQRSKELKETEEYLQQLVSRMPLALLAWNKEFKVKTWNPEATHIFGFSEQEFIGKNPDSLFLSQQDSSQANAIWKQLQKGEPANLIAENITKDGQTIICTWTNTPLRDENGNLDGVLSMIQDVTEKKKLEQRLKEITYTLSGVKGGESYLASSIQNCLKIVFDLNSHGVKSLCIVRENPDSLVKDYNFKPENIMLLSAKPIKEFKAISDLQEVAITITKFLKNGGGVVILGGLEYLISRCGFNPVFMMVQEKRFEFLEAGATLLVPANLEALENREKALLSSELKLLN